MRNLVPRTQRAPSGGFRFGPVYTPYPPDVRESPCNSVCFFSFPLWCPIRPTEGSTGKGSFFRTSERSGPTFRGPKSRQTEQRVLFGGFRFCLHVPPHLPFVPESRETLSVSFLHRFNIRYDPRRVPVKKFPGVPTGTALHFKVRNFVRQIQRGSSGGVRFCPGVPPNPPGVPASPCNSVRHPSLPLFVTYDPRRVSR